MSGSTTQPRHPKGSQRGGQFASKSRPHQSATAALSLDRERASSQLATTLYGSPLVLVEQDGRWARKPSLQTSEFGLISAAFDPKTYAQRGMNVVIGEMTASMLNDGVVTKDEALAVWEEFAWMQEDSASRKRSDDQASRLELLRLLMPVWELQLQPIWCSVKCGENGVAPESRGGKLYGTIDVKNDEDCTRRLQGSLDDLTVEGQFLSGHNFAVMLFRGTGEGFGARFAQTVKGVYNYRGLSQVDETFPARMYEARFDPARRCCFERDGRDPRVMPSHFGSYHYGCLLHSQAHLTPVGSPEFHAFVRDRLPVSPYHPQNPPNPLGSLLDQVALKHHTNDRIEAEIVEHMFLALSEAPDDKHGVTETHFRTWAEAHLADTHHPIESLREGFERHPLMSQLLARAETSPAGTEPATPIVPWWN